MAEIQLLVVKTARLFLLTLLALPVAAQVPNTLTHSIPPPSVGMQSGAELGKSVAMEGGYIVLCAPSDNVGGTDCGVVKVFDSTSGALLFLLPNPNPAPSDYFGQSVAISGTRVVVGAPVDDTVGFNTGSVYVFDLASGTPTVPVATLNNPTPAANDGFGQSVAISGKRVVVGAGADDVNATDAGIAYVYDLDSGTPTVPVVTLNNPTPAAVDVFGSSVAISGTRVVVAAPLDDTGASNAGTVYVYDLGTGMPTMPVLTLNNPSPAVDDRFGGTVVISNMRVIVGATYDDTGASDAGSVYVYDLGSSTPMVPVTTFNNPGPASGDHFGISVATSGMRVVVGAWLDDTGGINAGSVYVYDLGGGTPTVPVVTLNNPSPAMNDYFGVSVAISGTLMVSGSPNDDPGAVDAGSAYAYDLGSGTPTVPLAALNDPGPVPGDQFGASTAISGARMVVGASFDSTGALNAGSVHVYDLGSDSPTVPVVTLNNPDPANSDLFGSSVAISGSWVVVGADRDDTGASNAGSVYVYDLGSGTPTTPVVTLNNPTPAANDRFGSSVAISGTLVVVGAFQDDTSGFDAGSVYVYNLSGGTPTVPIVTPSNPTPLAFDYFGSSVAIQGTRVVVGASGDSTAGSGAGSAYVYDLGSVTPTLPVTTMNNPSPAISDSFGNSVAISGMRVVVGAYQDDTGATDTGSVYVYDLGSGSPSIPVATLNNPYPAFNDRFGWSVAISGLWAVVGAYQDDTGAMDAGSAYVYDLGSGNPTLPMTVLNNPYPAATDQFGTSVALDGTTIAIGTPLDDALISDKGYAYIFGPIDGDGDGLRDPWEIGYFGTQYGHGPLDDDDHDGIVNLLELGFGLNPTLPNGAGLPPAANEGNYLTMTLTKQSGVTYEVQSAGSLVPALPDSFSRDTTTVLIDDATTLKVRDNFLIGTSPPRFMRVKVMAAP